MTRDDAAFVEARAETLRYHRELYATTTLGEPGSWLATPQHSVVRAIAAMGADRPVVAYDLGAGVGRHTFPMLRMLAPGSRVIAVDLLAEAIATIRANAPSSSSELVTIAVDLAEFEFSDPADLIVAFSVIEHLPDIDSIREFLQRAARATNPGGLVHLGFVCDRYEIDAQGRRRPALLESGLSTAQANAVITDVFSEFEVLEQTQQHATVKESRAGDEYELSATLSSHTLRRL